MRRKHRDALEDFASKGYSDLATYNGEVARGIVHTEEWKEQMAIVKKLFDAEQRLCWEKNGFTVIEVSRP